MNCDELLEEFKKRQEILSAVEEKEEVSHYLGWYIKLVDENIQEYTQLYSLCHQVMVGADCRVSNTSYVCRRG